MVSQFFFNRRRADFFWGKRKANAGPGLVGMGRQAEIFVGGGEGFFLWPAQSLRGPKKKNREMMRGGGGGGEKNKGGGEGNAFFSKLFRGIRGGD